MCTGIEIAALAISAAASGAAYANQRQQAMAQAKYQNEMFAQTGQLAADNYTQQTGAAGARMIQNEAQAAQAQQENALAAMQARSHATVAAGEAGVAGNSVDDLLNDFSRVEALQSSNIRTNLSWANDQVYQEEKGMRADALSRIAGARPGPVNMPSSAALALQIGGAAVKSYGDYLKSQPKNADGSTGTGFTAAMTRPIFGGTVTSG